MPPALLQKKILRAGDPPPEGSINQILIDLRSRWKAFQTASQPTIYRLTHGFITAGSAIAGRGSSGAAPPAVSPSASPHSEPKAVPKI